MKFKIMVATLLMSTSLSSYAAWNLDGEKSSVKFVSVKKSSIAEVHEFKKLIGNIADDGVVRLEIDLSSVDTLIPIRDERMKEHLFEVKKYPAASISTTVDIKWLKALKVGEMSSVSVEAELSLHGVSKPLKMKLNAVKTNDGGVFVNSAEPVLVNAETFGMEAGVNKLMELASLPSISTAVPVTVSLKFAPVK